MSKTKIEEHPWYQFCVDEIDTAIKNGKKISEWDLDFLKNVKHRISLNLGLTPKQQDVLLRIRNYMTDIKRSPSRM